MPSFLTAKKYFSVTKIFPVRAKPLLEAHQILKPAYPNQIDLINRPEHLHLALMWLMFMIDSAKVLLLQPAGLSHGLKPG